MDWIGCFFQINHTEHDYVKAQVLAHCQGQWVISKEIADGTLTETNGQHFHIACQVTNEEYHKISTNIKRKYNLRGRAQDGKARQYGKIKEPIESADRLIAYCIKDDDFETNIEQERIDRCKELSFQKVPKTEYKKKEVNPRKATKTWSERVVDELINNSTHKELNHQHKWNHYRDKEIIVSKMLECLGRTAKKFNKGVFRDLYWGIYNALPKEYADHQKIVESMSDAVDEHI